MNFLKTFFFRRTPEKKFRRLFLWRTLALAFLVFGLGLEHSCPWLREGLFSEKLSLASASDFFFLGGSLALVSSLVSSTQPLLNIKLIFTLDVSN